MRGSPCLQGAWPLPLRRLQALAAVHSAASVGRVGTRPGAACATRGHAFPLNGAYGPDDNPNGWPKARLQDYARKERGHSRDSMAELMAWIIQDQQKLRGHAHRPSDDRSAVDGGFLHSRVASVSSSTVLPAADAAADDGDPSCPTPPPGAPELMMQGAPPAPWGPPELLDFTGELQALLGIGVDVQVYNKILADTRLLHGDNPGLVYLMREVARQCGVTLDLKVGMTTQPPKERQGQQSRKCGRNFEFVYLVPSRLPRLVEGLVLTELEQRGWRLAYKTPCRCGCKHEEWAHAPLDEVLEIVKKWRTFVELAAPRLLADFAARFPGVDQRGPQRRTRARHTGRAAV